MAEDGQPHTRADLEAFDYALKTAPPDDEPETEAERSAVAQARKDPRADLTLDEIKKRLALPARPGPARA